MRAMNEKRMRAIGRASITAGLLAAMALPPQAHALLNGECGGYYSRTTTCMFTAVGPNLTVIGSTDVSGIEVRVSDPTGNVWLLSCTGGFSCNGTAGVPSTGTDSVGPPAGVGPLLCMVITNGSGYFRCQSNI